MGKYFDEWRGKSGNKMEYMACFHLNNQMHSRKESSQHVSCCLYEGIVGDFCLFFYSVESPFSTLHTSFIIRKIKLYKEM